MKKLMLIVLFLLIPWNLFAIFVKNSNFTKIHVYATNSIKEADLIVYTTHIHKLAQNKEEIWEWVTDNPDTRISFTRSKTTANIIVYFTTIPSAAGWKKYSPLKGHLLQQ